MENEFPPSTVSVEEELALLRKKCEELAADGQYEACRQLLEENLGAFYRHERWPQKFFELLRLHRRCYTTLNELTHAEYITQLLRDNGIPTVLADMLYDAGSQPVWSSEHFKTMALLSQGRGELDKALDYSELVIRLDPASSTAYALRGQLWDQAGQAAQAVAMYRQALELAPSNHQASVSLAKHYLHTNPPAALHYINSAIQYAPGEAGYLALKVAVLRRMGNREEALAVCDEAIALDPYDPELPYQKAEILLENGQVMAAVSQYRRVLHLNDRHVHALYRLAKLYEQRQPELALRYVTTVVGMQPQDIKAGLLRAALLYHFGEMDAAAAQYELVLSLDSMRHEALAGLGWIALRRKDPARALELFTRALEFGLPIAAYHRGQGRAYAQLYQTKQALEALRQAVRLDDSDASTFAEMARLYAAEKEPVAAVECYRRALKLAPENVRYLSECGQLYISMGQTQQALYMLERAAQLAPGDAQVHIDFALLLEQQGNTVSAAIHFEAARTLAPEFPQAHYGLARLRCESDPAAALLHINRAIYLDGLPSEPYFWKGKILRLLARLPDACAQLSDLDTQEDLEEDERRYLCEGRGLSLALRYFNRVVEREPEREEYLLEQANTLLEMENAAAALEKFRHMLKHNAENPQALFGVARALAMQGAPEALAYFDRAIAINPQEPQYHAQRAAFLGRNPDTYWQALAGYDKAISLSPQSWQFLLEKARLLDAHKSALEACKYYRRVLLLQADCLEAATRLAVLLADILPRASLAYLSLAASLEPENYRHHIWRGRLYWQLGEQEEAEQAFAQALELGENGHAVHYAMAEILHEVDREIATQYCARAIEEAPEHPEYNRLQGDLYLEQGMVDEAIRCYDRALANDTDNHGALEKLAYILYKQQKPQSLARVDRALLQSPDCIRCLLLKADILSEQYGRLPEAVACVTQAVKLAPDVPRYREKLIMLLRQKRSFWRLHMERRRLARLQHRLAASLREESFALQPAQPE